MPRKKLPGISGRQLTVEVGSNVRIHPTAIFGSGVVLGNKVRIGRDAIVGHNVHLGDNVTIGPEVEIFNKVKIFDSIIGLGSHIGEKTTIYDSRLGRRVTVGAQTILSGPTVENDAFIGNLCKLYSSFYRRQTIGPRVVIGNGVFIDGAVSIEGTSSKKAASTVIKDGCFINCDAGKLVIEPSAEIGQGCKIYCWRDMVIKTPCTIGERVRLDASVGITSTIGNDCEIYANLGNYVTTGKRVIVRRNAHVPDHWLVPDDAILNPNPGSAAPVVITRPPPRS